MTVQPCHAIPWHRDNAHSKGTFDGFAIVPLSPGWRYDVLPQNLQRVRQYLKQQQLLAGNPSAQEKYDEHIHWIQQLSLRWDEFLGIPPIELFPT
jgi:hypothetical protein